MEEVWRKDNRTRQTRKPRRRPVERYRLTESEAAPTRRAAEGVRGDARSTSGFVRDYGTRNSAAATATLRARRPHLGVGSHRQGETRAPCSVHVGPSAVATEIHRDVGRGVRAARPKVQRSAFRQVATRPSHASLVQPSAAVARRSSGSRDRAREATTGIEPVYASGRGSGPRLQTRFTETPDSVSSPGAGAGFQPPAPPRSGAAHDPAGPEIRSTDPPGAHMTLDQPRFWDVKRTWG
jgi:hypothetical protein